MKLRSLRSLRGTAIKRAAPWHGVMCIEENQMSQNEKLGVRFYALWFASWVAIVFLLLIILPSEAFSGTKKIKVALGCSVLCSIVFTISYYLFHTFVGEKLKK